MVKKVNDIDEFVLTRGEYAKRVGKTKNAVRLAMRRGQYSGEYRYDGKQFLFKDPNRPRAYKGNNQGSPTTPKKTYNRGNHYNANYPNDSFRKYNEAKMLRAVNERDPEFIKDYKEIREKHKIEKQRAAQKKVEQTKTVNYGRMLTGPQPFNIKHQTKWKELEPKEKEKTPDWIEIKDDDGPEYY